MRRHHLGPIMRIRDPASARHALAGRATQPLKTRRHRHVPVEQSKPNAKPSKKTGGGAYIGQTIVGRGCSTSIKYVSTEREARAVLMPVAKGRFGLWAGCLTRIASSSAAAPP